MTEIRATDIVVRMATTGLVGVVAVVNPLAGVALAIAKEQLDHALVSATDAIGGMGRRAIERLFAAATNTSGMTAPELVERLDSTDSSRRLLAEAIEASIRTSVPEKIAALGRLVADGAADNSTIDEARVLIKRLAELEEFEIRLLRLLESEPPASLMQGIPVAPSGWQPAQIVEADPAMSRVVHSLLATLQSVGFARDAGGPWPESLPEEHQWAITESGRNGLALLR